MNKKAQHFSIDFIVAVTIFLFLFLSLSSNWDQTIFRINAQGHRYLLEETTDHILDSLVYGTGYPHDWYNRSDYSRIGLSSIERGVLDEEKIIALSLDNSTGYDSYKDMLGIPGEIYDFHLNISIYENDFSLNSSYAAGYAGECTVAAVRNRLYAIDNGRYANIKLKGCER